MNDSDRREAYDFIRGLAVERGLLWAVVQAEEQMEEGKTVELAEPVKVKLPGNKRTSTISSGTVTIPLSDLERLEVLCRAVQTAVLLPHQLEADIAAQMKHLQAAGVEIELIVSLAGARDEGSPGQSDEISGDGASRPRALSVGEGLGDDRAVRLMQAEAVAVSLDAVLDGAS